MLREDAVAIVNQEFVSLFAPDGLTQLLQRVMSNNRIDIRYAAARW
jgi:hypothetical protein